MKKLLIFLQCMVMVLCLASCEKDPSPSAKLNLEDAYRIFNRNRGGNLNMVYSGSTVYSLYEMYIYKDGRNITTFSAADYSGCENIAISNYSATKGTDMLSGDRDTTPDEFIEITFDRVITEAVEATDTTSAVEEVKYRYNIKYYTDREAFITGINPGYEPGLDDESEYYTWDYRATEMNVYSIGYNVIPADPEAGTVESTEEVSTLIQTIVSIGVQDTQFARE